jgi:hypothetical protein
MVPMAFWTFWLKNTPLIIRLERSSVTRWLGWYMPRCRASASRRPSHHSPTVARSVSHAESHRRRNIQTLPGGKVLTGKTPVYLAARLIAHLVGTKLTKEGHA